MLPIRKVNGAIHHQILGLETLARKKIGRGSFVLCISSALEFKGVQR